MQKRYMAIWFRYLLTDGLIRRRPEFKEQALVIAAPQKNRMVITASSPVAEREGAFVGMAVADARAATVDLVVLDDVPGTAAKLLRLIGIGCIRYTPIVSLNLPNGLILDISGCAHLWGGERGYLKELVNRLRSGGFNARAAIADTPAAAWAVARFAKKNPIVPFGGQAQALAILPPAALRLEPEVNNLLKKLGFNTIAPLLTISPQALRRRFGQNLLTRLGQALGTADEYWEPISLPVNYMEWLPCMEPVRTAPGIEIAINTLLERTCVRLQGDGKGIRKAMLKCHRIDGRKVQVSVSTTRASHSVSHLMRLFKLQVAKIEPALGIELFVLEVLRFEDMEAPQEALWAEAKGLADANLAELLDKIAGKIGADAIKRYLPAEHHWPERSLKVAGSLQEQPETQWPQLPRPIRLLPIPEQIEVMALVPDHPPKVFTFKNKRHTVARADGPERIGREWWQDKGEHRDYYMVEDTEGQRYWLFRSGHYDGNDARWYLHGYFA